MPFRSDHFAEIETVEVDTSAEAFDRVAFARRALSLVRSKKAPELLRVVFCETAYRVRVETGRQWGQNAGERWAIVSLPAMASRRAIALAMASLASPPHEPYALDVLLNEATREP